MQRAQKSLTENDGVDMRVEFLVVKWLCEYWLTVFMRVSERCAQRSPTHIGCEIVQKCPVYWADEQQISRVIAPWWFSVSLWQICTTFVWPRSSLKLPAPSSWWERHLHFASIRLCLDLLFIISIAVMGVVDTFELGTIRRACGHVDVGTCPHQVLAATLTLSQPGGQIMPTLYWCPHQVLKATGAPVEGISLQGG